MFPISIQIRVPDRRETYLFDRCPTKNVVNGKIPMYYNQYFIARNCIL